MNRESAARRQARAKSLFPHLRSRSVGRSGHTRRLRGLCLRILTRVVFALITSLIREISNLPIRNCHVNLLPRKDPEIKVHGKVQFVTAFGLVIIHFDVDFAFGDGGCPGCVDAGAEIAFEGDNFEVVEDPNFDVGVESFGVTINDKLRKVGQKRSGIK